jgi:tetratricopeptide (TPR) repeat protein
MALAAALACCAAAQTSGATERWAEGRQLRAQGRCDEARQVFVALLRDAQADAPDSRLVAVLLDDLGVDEEDCGNYAEAETAFNHALAAMQGSVADDPVPVALKTHLAELYTAEMRPEAADPLLRQATAALRSSAHPDRKALSLAYLDLVITCTMQRRFQEAETTLRQAQALLETEYGPNSPALAAGLLSYAGLLTSEHRYAEAVAPAERAWQILQASPAPFPKPYLASALDVLGTVYYHTGRTAEAKSCVRRCVELAEASLGPRHPRMGLYLSNYAVILKRAGSKREAKDVRKRAGKILAEPGSGASAGYTVNVGALR